MKLAEALIQRANLQKRIEELRTRLMANAKVQEGDVPGEIPSTLLDELNETISNLRHIIVRINRTNSVVVLDGDDPNTIMTISDAIARRDGLKMQHGIYRELVNAATVRHDRFSKSEIRFVPTVDITAAQRVADNLAQMFRSLDAKLQAKNWEVEVLD